MYVLDDQFTLPKGLMAKGAQEVADSHFRVELYIFFSLPPPFFLFFLIPCVCGIREKKQQLHYRHFLRTTAIC
jgi:hypothetical protein